MPSIDTPTPTATTKSASRGAPGTPITGIGNGYNTFLQSAMPTQLTFSVQNGHTSLSTNVYVCSSQSQMYKALGISAAMEVHGFWGSFADKLDFVQSSNATSSSLIVIAVATAVTSIQSIQSPFWIQPPSDADALSLYRQGGDSFVNSITLGGQYMAAFTFNAADAEDFLNVQNVANADFQGWGTSVSGNFAVEIENVASTSGVNYSLTQKFIGFSPSGRIPGTAEDVLQFINNWPTVTIDNPTVFNYTTLSYTTITGCPQQFSQIDTNRKVFVDLQGNATRLSDYQLMAQASLQAIQSVSSMYNRYGCISADEGLSNFPAALLSLSNSITTWVDQIDTDPTRSDVQVPIVDTTLLRVPHARYTIVPGQPPTGPQAGATFTDVAMRNIAQGILPSQVTIRGTGNPNLGFVTALTTMYQVEDGGTFQQPGTHGGSGQDSPPLQLGPGEFVTSVVAMNGGGLGVGQLSITTNFGNTLVWPTSHLLQGPVTKYTTPLKGAFVGWTGGVNDDGLRLNWIAPLYAQFESCAWIVPPNLGTSATSKAPTPEPSKDALVPLMPDEIRVACEIEKWAIAAWPRMKQAYLQKGGWERWAQVELANSFQAKFSALSVQREYRAYQNNWLADIVLRHPGEMSQVIELKCESLWQDGLGASRFWTALLGDMDRVSHNPVNSDLLPARLWTIGFSLVGQVTRAGIAYSWPAIYDVSYTPLGKPDADGDQLCVWWMHKDVRAS